MSKIIRTSKPSVLPWYAAALVFVVLCAALPVYKLWALLAALGGACAAFGAAKKFCPPRVVETEVPFHTGVDDVDAMLTEMQKQLDTLHALNEALPEPNLSAAMTRMEKGGPLHRRDGGSRPRQGQAGAPVRELLPARRRECFAAVREARQTGRPGRKTQRPSARRWSATLPPSRRRSKTSSMPSMRRRAWTSRLT